MGEYRRTVEYTYDQVAKASEVRFVPARVGGVWVSDSDGPVILDFDRRLRLVSFETLRPRGDLPDWEFVDTWARGPRPELRSPGRWKRPSRRGWPWNRRRFAGMVIARPIFVTHDARQDTAYLRMNEEPAEVRETYEVPRGGLVDRAIRVDLDARSALVGIEVGNASRALAPRMLPSRLTRWLGRATHPLSSRPR